MDKRTYTMTGNALKRAHEVLGVAAETSEHFRWQRINSAMAALVAAADALRVQACKRCNKDGHYRLPGQLGVRTCDHPDTPFIFDPTGRSVRN